MSWWIIISIAFLFVIGLIYGAYKDLRKVEQKTLEKIKKEKAKEKEYLESLRKK